MTTTQRVTTDVEIENHGTVFRFLPVTAAAREWIDENVEAEPYQWMGPALIVDHRMARDLADGMVRAGLRVS